MKFDVGAWLRQPTTITGIATAISTLIGLLAQYLTGSVTASTGGGLAAFAVVHMLMPDNSAAPSSIQRFVGDAITAATEKNVQQALPALLAEGFASVQAIMPPAAAIPPQAIVAGALAAAQATPAAPAAPAVQPAAAPAAVAPVAALLLVLAVALGLSACNGTAAFSAATVASDVELIDAGLSAAIPQVQGLTTTQIAAAEAALGDIQTAATDLAAVSTLAGAQTDVQTVVDDLPAISAALSAVPLPPAVQTALQAAEVLLPVIEAAVSLPAPVGASAAAMTPAQARAALHALAGG